MGRLRELAIRRSASEGPYGDLWQTQKLVFLQLRQSSSPLGLPGLGGLFNASQCQALEACELGNRFLLRAMRAIGWFQAGDTLTRVNYRDLNTEELGSVYEGLLELHPQLERSGGSWQLSYGGGAGSDRKTTGSYYTPDQLVQLLIVSALLPVIADRLSKASTREEKEAALLAIRVLDPACGSGHFLLAAARRLALELARIRAVLQAVSTQANAPYAPRQAHPSLTALQPTLQITAACWALLATPTAAATRINTSPRASENRIRHTASASMPPAPQASFAVLTDVDGRGSDLGVFLAATDLLVLRDGAALVLVLPPEHSWPSMLLPAALGPRRTRTRTVQWAGPMCSIRASRASCCSSSSVGAVMRMGRVSARASRWPGRSASRRNTTSRMRCISFLPAPSLIAWPS